MHPLLVHFCPLTSCHEILGSEENSISFLQDMGLIPKKETFFKDCYKCDSQMRPTSDVKRTLGWRWKCKNNKCSGSKNPLHNTFFKGTQLEIREILAIIIEFVRQTKVTRCHEIICAWRMQGCEKKIHISTVIDFFSFCREV